MKLTIHKKDFVEGPDAYLDMRLTIKEKGFAVGLV